MDDNARDVVIALVTITGGLVTAYIVASITVRASRNLDRDKWKRELYASFVHSTNEIRDAVRQIITGGAPSKAGASTWIALRRPFRRSR